MTIVGEAIISKKNKLLIPFPLNTLSREPGGRRPRLRYRRIVPWPNRNHLHSPITSTYSTPMSSCQEVTMASEKSCMSKKALPRKRIDDHAEPLKLANQTRKLGISL